MVVAQDAENINQSFCLAWMNACESIWVSLFKQKNF